MKSLSIILSGFLITHSSVSCFGQTSSNESSKPIYTVLYGRDLPNLEYPEDAKVEEGNLVDERKEGYWSRYYEDGLSLKQKGEFENNRPNGKYTKYYQNGKLKESGTFTNLGFKDSLKRYWENGKLEYEAIYNQQGKEQGLVKYHYKSGELEYCYEAVNGKPTNEKRFNEDGTAHDLKAEKQVTIVETELFSKKITAPHLIDSETPASFKPNEYNKITHQDLIYQEGIFKNGDLFDGKHYIYDENMQLIKIEIYKEGFLHSYGQI